MVLLIVILVFGSLFAYLAAQNNTLVDVEIFFYTLDQVPVYLIAFFSLWVGVVITWLINATHLVSKSLNLRGKEGQLKKGEQSMAQLTKRIHQLEIENKKLKKELGTDDEDEKSL